MKNKKDDNRQYKVNVYPLKTLVNFESELNLIAGNGWTLQHIFVTPGGLKVVTIWEK